MRTASPLNASAPEILTTYTDMARAAINKRFRGVSIAVTPERRSVRHSHRASYGLARTVYVNQAVGNG